MKDLIKIKGAFIPTILTSRKEIQKATTEVDKLTKRVRIGETNESGNETKNYWIFKGM